MDSKYTKVTRDFRLILLNQLLANLNGTEGPQWQSELLKFLSKKSCWANEVTANGTPIGRDKLLKTMSAVAVDRRATAFAGKSRFRGLVLSDRFKEWFICSKRPINGSIAGHKLRYYVLSRSAMNMSIIAELGGEAKSATELSQLFWLISAQKSYEDGALLNNGYANLFYIVDNSGLLRTVYVINRGGWCVIANSIDDVYEWREGSRVFSCMHKLSR